MVFTAYWKFLSHSHILYGIKLLSEDAVLSDLKSLNAFHLYHVTLSWREDEGSHLAPGHTLVELQQDHRTLCWEKTF